MSPDIQNDREINETALLNVLIYLKNDAKPDNGNTVGDIIKELKYFYGHDGSYKKYKQLHPNGKESEYEANVRMFEKLEQASNNNPNFSSLVIENQSNLMGYNTIGLNAATFTDRNGKVTVGGTGL